MGLSSQQRRLLQSTGSDVRFDRLSRVLYSTDASIYKVEPAAVARPENVDGCATVVRAAAAAGLGLTPRGAGTGLTGGALGEGVVVDLSAHLTDIGVLDRESLTIEVGAGVVLDHLNRTLAPHGLWFGPDVATSSRATLGGMVANNSSGAHAPVYGTTADHVEALQILLADGSKAWVGRGRDGFETLRKSSEEVVARRRREIERRLPSDLVKRRPGYDLHRFLRDPADLAGLMAGSEGTLALILSAILRVVPRPQQRGLGVICFNSVAQAMAAMADIVRLEPAAVEHLDRLVFDQSRGRLEFSAARALLDLDDRPCESLLLVEFFDDARERLARLEAMNLGDRCVVCAGPEERELVWQLRRSGLSLVTGCVGPAKPTTVIEDCCVRPEHLPAFVEGLEALLADLGLRASFYGHAASGLLHVRPTLDLHLETDVGRLRALAAEVSELVRRFGGSLAGEHGVGVARTEFLGEHLGPDLTSATEEIKGIFDPAGLLNPGKIVDSGRWKVDRDLRLGPGSELDLGFEPLSAFIEKAEGFVGNLEQCNGCGGCRKTEATMCPTFRATGEEVLSTRGRANVLRAALEGRFDGGVASSELAEVLGACLSCKACKRECPSGVDLALLKAEALQARHRQRGPSLADRAIGASDALGRLGCALAPVSNALLKLRPARHVLERILGFDRERSIPTYARTPFDTWFRRRQARGGGAGRVILWDDTWVRFNEPQVGRAAVRVLEAAGFEVLLADGRRCCGRPSASRGLLDRVRALGEHNVSVLNAMERVPVIFLEPSCWSMFVDDYRQMGIEGAEDLAGRCVLFEDFVNRAVEEGCRLPLRPLDGIAAVHTHCHADALGGSADIRRVLGGIPGLEIRFLDTGCCGMAGAFGMMVENRDLSRAVAHPLVELVRDLPEGARVVAAGTSCRHQVRDLVGREVLHPAQVLAEALAETC